MKDKLRIGLISINFWPSVGGAQIQLEKLARQLQALGHEVTIFTLRLEKHWKRREMLDSLPIVRIGGLYTLKGHLRRGRLGHLPIDINIFLTLWRLRHTFDIIHSFQVSAPTATAALIGKITRKPVIISIQSAGPTDEQRIQLKRDAMLMADTLTNTDFLKIDSSKEDFVGEGDLTCLPNAALGGRVLLNFLRRSNTFYQVLSSRTETYLSLHGFRSTQAVCIPNGVDTEKFRPAPDQWRDLTNPQRDIICVARLEYAKGVDVVLHAWGRMMQAPPEWCLHLQLRLRLVGDGELRPQLERIVKELGISESVEFLGLRTDVASLLQQSWGFVMPSRWEGMPNALLEGMACGLPAIATRVSGNEDIIDHGVNGLLVTPEHPAEMAQALRLILEDATVAQRLGREGRMTILRDYQISSVAERTLKLYRSLLAANKEREQLLEAVSTQTTFSTSRSSADDSPAKGGVLGE